ncbi:MAG: AAA family ATPase, partial [Microvirga sp.]
MKLGSTVALAAPPVASRDTEPKHPASSAERRQLTVMFCDLVDSTALSVRLDPEDLRDVIAAYHTCVGEVMRRFGGFVAKYMGDGVLVYFGYPQAHEEDGERAVRAGLALIEAMGRLAPSPEQRQVRVGIATGVVVVGDLTGSGEAQERGIVGDTPNLAARLQALAVPNAVIIAEATHRLVGTMFEVQSLGFQALKGIAGPAQAFRVLRERPTHSRFDARARTLYPLIGRENELGLLLDRWRQAKTGEGQAVLLVGEAGIGKSRITTALLEALGSESLVRIRCQGSPLYADTAFWPVIQHLTVAANFEPNDDAAARLQKLEALLRMAVSDLGPAFALVADLMGFTTDDPGVRELTPQQRRARTFDALLAQLLGLSGQGPVLILVEDAHWLDPTTLALMARVLDQIARVPVLVVLTSRPDHAPALGTYSYLTQLTLNRLSRAAAAAITEHIAGKPLPAEVIEAILDRTDGVPLYVEELTKAVLEAGILRETNEGYVLDEPLPPFAIPASLQGSLMARLDRLQPVKEVAQIAACVGREFDYRLLAAIAPLPEPELRDAMDRLAAAGLIFGRGPPSEAIYTFKHALVRDAAYESLLKARRKAVHQRIAEALAQKAAEGADVAPEILAHHYAAAGAFEAAAREWLEAGRRNARRSANTEAIQYFERALRALGDLPDRAELRKLELELQLALMPVLMCSIGFAQRRTLEVAERALVLCEEFGMIDRVLPILFGQLSYYTASAQLVPALEIARRILQLGETSGDTLARFVGHRTVGFCQAWIGNLTAAEREFDQAIHLAGGIERQDLAFEFGHDLRITGLAVYSVAKLRLGYIDAGCRQLAEATSRAKDLNHPLTLAFVLQNRSTFAALIRDYREVQRSGEALGAFCAQQGIRQWRYLGDLLHLWASMQLAGEGEPACLVRAFEQHQGGGYRLNKPFHL